VGVRRPGLWAVEETWGLGDPPADPLSLFTLGLARAEALGVRYPDCMTLATASASGRPSARTVILKGHDAEGLLFETQSYSRKGLELAENPFAAVTVHWREVARQVTATGAAEVLPADLSDEMWDRRPRANRAATLVSEQGAVLVDEPAMIARVETLAGSEDPLVRPATYHAYRLVADTMEFWEGSEVRLHRRLFYERGAGGTLSAWTHRRIQP
jgi:pyridoxamine-phosphate oxidase